MNLVDSHCHLDLPAGKAGMIRDIKIALLRAKEAGVTTIINVGTSIDASRQSIEIAEGTDLVDVYATCGIHAQEGPKDIKKYGANFIDELRKIAESSKKVVGIGECGLDYFLKDNDKEKTTSSKEKQGQRELFEKQIKLANDLDLPLIVHCRNAWDETFGLLTTDYGLPTRSGVFHSWTGNWKQAKKALDLGFYISFSGIVTFKQSLRSSSLEKLGTVGLKNAPLVQEVAKRVPLTRMLVETDSPFLSPEPVRGKKNSPENVRITAQFLANLRGISLDKLSGITTGNAKKLFRIS